MKVVRKRSSTLHDQLAQSYYNTVNNMSPIVEDEIHEVEQESPLLSVDDRSITHQYDNRSEVRQQGHKKKKDSSNSAILVLAPLALIFFLLSFISAAGKKRQSFNVDNKPVVVENATVISTNHVPNIVDNAGFYRFNDMLGF